MNSIGDGVAGTAPCAISTLENVFSPATVAMSRASCSTSAGGVLEGARHSAAVRGARNYERKIMVISFLIAACYGAVIPRT